MSKIEYPVYAHPDNRWQIKDADGKTILSSYFDKCFDNSKVHGYCDEVIHRLNGYDVAVKALRKISACWGKNWCVDSEDFEPGSEADIIYRALKDLGELDT